MNSLSSACTELEFPRRLGCPQGTTSGQEGRTVGHSLQGILTAVSVVGHSNDAHGLLGDVNAQQLHVSAHIFVGSLHGTAHPIRPEDVITINSQAKGVDRL